MMLCSCRLARISLLSRLGALPELALSGLITLGQAGSLPRHPIVAHCVMFTVLRGVLSLVREMARETPLPSGELAVGGCCWRCVAYKWHNTHSVKAEWRVAVDTQC